jgi:tRNA (guanine37-N1)-methyltransferase
MIAAAAGHSILKRACDQGRVQIAIQSIRDHAPGLRRQVDDDPYGGGPGMVLKPDILDRALTHTLQQHGPGLVIELSPQGVRFTQSIAQELAQQSHLILVCGHYEGVDERFTEARVERTLSLGDFVLTGGEIPAMAVMDAVVRLLPNVLGDAASVEQDSFQTGLLDHPHYTRPEVWDGHVVPPVLRSGHHGEVAAWRRRQALLRTLIRRPDLIAGARLSRQEQRLIHALAVELEAIEQSDRQNGRDHGLPDT